MAEDLTYEEGIAVGLAVQRVGEPHRGVVECVTGGSLHERDHTDVVESGQPDTRHALLSMQRSQCFEERMRVRQLTIAIGPQHQHAHRLLRRDHMTQQLQACLVRPLQVVEHHDDRLFLRHHHQQPDHCREEQVTLRVGISRQRFGKPWQPARQRWHQPDQV